MAMAALTIAFTSESLMGMVYKAQDDLWPSGKAHLVMEALMEQYEPKDRISRVEMRTRLNNVKLSAGENPKAMFEQLAAIDNAYKNREQHVEEDDMVAVVLGQAPKMYTTVLTTEQRIRGDNLKLKDLELAMNAQWRISGAGVNANEDDNGTELGLSSFTGTCYKCKKSGHKAYQCKAGGSGSSNQDGRNKKSFNGKCNNCGKKGHKKVDCWDMEENRSKRPQGYQVGNNGNNAGSSQEHAAASVSSNNVEFLLVSGGQMTFPDSPRFLKDPCVWIADSGATTHSTPHADHVALKKKAGAGSSLTMGNGVGENVTGFGDIQGTVCDKSGNKVSKTKLTDVSICPQSAYNLFSLTRMVEQGWIMSGDKNGISIKKGKSKVLFDIKISTPKGALYCMYLKPDVEVAAAMVAGSGTVSGGPKKSPMSIDVAHELLGHTDERRTRETAKHLGWELKEGKMKPCGACTAGKAKQKSVPKESTHQVAKSNGERVFLDIATVKAPPGQKGLVNSNWRMLVDEKTQLKFSTFHQSKSGMVEPTCEQFQKWKAAGMPVKQVRCDNAGENKQLEKRAASADWKLDIDFEYTARDTPQQNHLAEIALAVITNRGRALMHRANVPYEMKFKLWKEAFRTATLLDGLTVCEIDGKKATRYEHWCGRNPAFAKHLRTWGEVGTVKVKTKTSPKLADKGKHCVFVGYAESHDGDCYRM